MLHVKFCGSFESYQQWKDHKSLSRQLDYLCNTAKNYARDDYDIITLSIYNDHVLCNKALVQPMSFYFEIIRDGNRCINGGIIWHVDYGKDDPMIGEYSIHT